MDYDPKTREMIEFEAEEVVPHYARHNAVFQVLPELTPTSAELSLARHGQTVTAAWRVAAGLVVVEFPAVVAAQMCESGATQAMPLDAKNNPGMYFVEDSDAIWRARRTWVGQQLSTSDQFGSGHVIVTLSDGSTFEAVGPTWIEFVVEQNADSVDELLTAFMSNPKPSGGTNSRSGREKDWVQFRPDPIWLNNEYRTRSDTEIARSTPKDRHLSPGTPVIYDGTGTSEHGVVIRCWVDEATGLHDCYVAFSCTNDPRAKPYILRYFAGSLSVAETTPD